MESKPIKRNKKQLNINISPYLYRKMEELIETTKEFSGYSDIGELAIAQFIERYRPPADSRATKAAGGMAWGVNKIPQSVDGAFKSPC